MLLIVGLSSDVDPFPFDTLAEVDAALAAAGYKKQVRSVLKPGKEFLVTYEGPTAGKTRLHNILKPIAERNAITFTIEMEESVRFP